MATLRGVLTDQVGEVSVDVEGTLDGAEGGSTGMFEFPDLAAVMEGVMNGQTFTLSTDDGQQLSIKIDNVTQGTASGTSRAEFTVV
ncbi:MAG: hypothetical protein AB7I30_14120 [Isosphaeraceae bacterium]